MTELAGRCRRAGTAAEAARLDRALHAEIGRLGGNPVLAALAASLCHPAAHDAAWRWLWAARHELHDEHDRLVEALRRGDPDWASGLALAHSIRLSEAPGPPAGGSALAASASIVERGVSRTRESILPVERETPSWYRDAKLGVIIHWGIYSVPGWAPLDESLVELLTDNEIEPHQSDEPDPLVTHPFAEWYQNSALLVGSPTWHYHRATYGRRPYASFRRAFEIALRAWDPAEWTTLFAEAGARYVVPVAKHHDGYLLWPSAHRNPQRSNWAAPRDVIGEVARAARDRGMRLGLYYSSGIDWTFAHLPISRMIDVHASVPPSVGYARYVDAHWRELIDRYEPDMLWDDMGYPAKGELDQLFAEYYRRVPQGLVTDRFGAARHDVSTPNYARRHVIDPRVWEGARPVGLSFGWNRQEDERHTLTGTQLVHLLIDVISKNGNLLLGVAPDNYGHIPELQARSLRELGRWLSRYGVAVYGSRPWTVAESSTADGLPVRYAVRDRDLFVFLLGRPAGEVLVSDLHVPSSATVTEIGTGVDVPARAGRRGTIFQLLGAVDGPARVLRIAPSPPG